MIQKTYHITDFTDGSLERALSEVAALDAYRGASQVLAVVFAQLWDRDALARHVQAVCAALPKAEVAGVTHFDTLGAFGQQDDSPRAVFSFFFFEHPAFTLRRLAGQGDTDTLLGRRLNRDILAQENCKGVLTLAAAFGRNLDTVLAEADRGAADIPIFGGTASLDPAEPQRPLCFVFDSDGVYEDTLLAVLFHGSGLSVRTTVNFGWTPVGRTMTVTATDGDFCVTEIDGQSALDIYRKYLGLSIPSLIQVPNICEFPFAVDRDGMTVGRVPLLCDEEGRLHFGAAMRAGEQFRFSYGLQTRILSQIHDDAEECLAFAPQGMLLFICMNRLIFLKEQERHEINYYSQVASDTAFQHGSSELFRFHGQGGELNSALVAFGIREGEPERREAQLDKYALREDAERSNYVVPLEYRIMAFLNATSSDLLEMTERANAASKAKSNFLSSMSHEIRTPINAVLGMNEMILRESAEKVTRSYAEDIQSAGKTLLSLVNDILDFSKVEEGKLEIIPAQYDLSSVVNDLVNMVRERAEKKGLHFAVQVDENIPDLLLGDEIRIRQCALNLLTNAVKYTEKGSVTLDVGFEKLSDDKISLRFRVVDTGIGIKHENMNTLFAPFARIEEARNRAIEGTGLGMSITRRLLGLMGSELEVESVYGEGSTFSFAVEQPVVRWTPIGKFSGRFETAAAQRKAYRERFHAPEARVLVVDDTPVNLTVVQGLLKKTQVRVDTAESGPEALQKAAGERYDVIFIDHMMPGMDGVETLRRLRELPGTAESVCVALTANAVTGSRERYLEVGFDDYLPKPVDGAALEELLIRCLPPEKVHEPEAPAPAAPAAPVSAEKPLVLIVDDDALITSLAGSILGKICRVEACQDGAAAAQEAQRLRPDLILLDINLGAMTGFDVLAALRRDSATGSIPVIFLTGDGDEETEITCFRRGAADFVRKPFVPEVLLQRTRRVIALDRLQRSLQSEVRRQSRRAQRLTKEMMLALSKTVDAKDHYTNGHSERVAAYSAEIARRMGKSAREQVHIYEMGLLHDVGKIGVSEEIINKTTRLTDEEFALIQRHTVIGSEILSQISEMPELAYGARSHHERFDGTGYPDGLKGRDIPEPARIIGLADAYDAMTSTRTYSTPKAQSVVRAEIVRCSGTQFDPEIAAVFLQMIDEDTDYRMNERTADIRVWKNSDRLWSTEDAPPVPDAPVPDASAPAAAEPEPQDVELPDWLRGIGELDIDSGLRHCGTEETYLETLTVYGKNAAAAADEIEGFWRAGDTANTTVKVHALKSTSRAVGAEELGALAEKLEMAGKAGDTQTLGAELGGLLTRFRALGAALAPLYAPAGDAADADGKPEITPEKLREAYDSLREFAAGFDSDGAAYVLGYLDGFRLPEDERARVERVRRAVDSFDWDQVGPILSSTQSEVSQ
ncbi:MAG: response regulator [Ruminococcaceae bacterium]|nr:response regulator [Oscillospiraceae bacterium]